MNTRNFDSTFLTFKLTVHCPVCFYKVWCPGNCDASMWPCLPVQWLQSTARKFRYMDMLLMCCWLDILQFYHTVTAQITIKKKHGRYRLNKKANFETWFTHLKTMNNKTVSWCLEPLMKHSHLLKLHNTWYHLAE